jgi:transketolase
MKGMGMEVINDISYYENISRKTRRYILEIIYKTKSPHIGSSFSIVEILVALYFKFLNHSPNDRCNSHRDRFLLSKGHACPAFFVVLAKRGFLDEMELEKFAVNGCSLAHHPDKDLNRGIEISSGSLGHGLSIGIGMALAGNFDDIPYKTYVLLGDGELNEGSVWEAIMFAGHHKLHNLVALVDYNRMQALGHTKDIIELDPLGEKWKAFGWHAQEVDGHSYEQISHALSSLSLNKPNVIILNTIKGKGVSFMEDKLLWHYKVPDREEYELALEELSQ